MSQVKSTPQSTISAAASQSPYRLSGTGAEGEPTREAQYWPSPRGADAELSGSVTLLQAQRRQVAVFAHRGASGLFAEHSRAAYLRAIEEGADGLEVDLHLSQDGEPVCIHDDSLARTTSGAGRVSAASLAYLRSLDITSWKNPNLPARYGAVDQQFMTLQDVLEIMLDAGRPLRLALEFKHPATAGNRLQDRCIEVLLRYGWDPETSVIRGENNTVDVSFMGFSMSALKYIQELIPASQLCALFDTVSREDVTEKLGELGLPAALRPVGAAYARRCLSEAESMVWTRHAGMAGPGLRYAKAHPAELKAWIARGSVLRVWTVDRPEDADWLQQLGVQEITTNHPARILAAPTP